MGASPKGKVSGKGFRVGLRSEKTVPEREHVKDSGTDSFKREALLLADARSPCNCCARSALVQIDSVHSVILQSA
jgi:hypothetical protein